MVGVIGRIRAHWRAGPDPWWKATVVFTGVVLVLLAVLAVTGTILSFTYRPDRDADALRSVHATGSTLLVLNALALLVAGVGLTSARQRVGTSRLQAAAGFAILTGALVGAAFTGALLAWDQLALVAVATGSSQYDGIWAAAFDDGIRFVLIDGVEVAPGDYAVWAITHVAVLPVGAVALLILLGRKLGRRGTFDPVPEGEEPRA
jgi:quinol-cytochrome oxidoreductase complex cytochrome b subunit